MLTEKTVDLMLNEYFIQHKNSAVLRIWRPQDPIKTQVFGLTICPAEG